MRKLALAVLVVALALSHAGCFLFSSDHDTSPAQPLKSVIFRLGAQPDNVELRFEADYYPSHNWEVVCSSEGKVGVENLVVTIRGVREPQDPKGSAAPAAARLLLPREPGANQAKWPLVLLFKQRDSAEVKDVYTVERLGNAWKVTPEQGTFSRYSAQGSY